MMRISYRSAALSTFTVLACSALLALAAPPQRPGPGTEPKPQPRGGPKPPEPNPRGGAQHAGGLPEGTHAKGMVNGFTLAKDSPGDDDTLVGTLSIKPYEKGAKLLTLRVHRDVEYTLGGKKLDPDTAVELLWKGLFVSVTFDVDHPSDPKKKSPTQKALKALDVDTVDLEGTVIEVGEDYVILNAKPIKGDWPDAEPPKAGTTPLVKAVKPRQLKLKSIEKVTRYLNQDRKPTEPGEFAKDQKIEAFAGIGKGKAQGLLLTLQPPLAVHTQESRGPRPPVAPRPPTGGPRKAGG